MGRIFTCAPMSSFSKTFMPFTPTIHSPFSASSSCPHRPETPFPHNCLLCNAPFPRFHSLSTIVTVFTKNGESSSALPLSHLFSTNFTFFFEKHQSGFFFCILVSLFQRLGTVWTRACCCTDCSLWSSHFSVYKFSGLCI